MKGKAKQKAKAATVSGESLCALSGLTDRRHRQLAEQGYFPPPIRGQYQTTPTISGLFRYYKEYSQRHHAAREGIEQEKLTALKRENEAAAGKLVAIEKVSEQLQKLLTPLKEILRSKLESELPVAMSGMGVAENRIVGKRMFDDLCERFAEAFGKMKV